MDISGCNIDTCELLNLVNFQEMLELAQAPPGSDIEDSTICPNFVWPHQLDLALIVVFANIMKGAFCFLKKMENT